jgi:predicted nucleic acid-binding protein
MIDAIDTTPLVARCAGRDPYHDRVVDDLKRLAQSAFATCDGVLAERCFHLPHRSQRLRLRTLLDHLAVSPLPRSADTAYRDRSSTGSRTYDSEFSTVWRQWDGTAMPLAVG